MAQRRYRTRKHLVEAEKSVIAWLVALERGRRTGDFDLIRRANAELARLGVTVTFASSSDPMQTTDLGSSEDRS